MKLSKSVSLTAACVLTLGVFLPSKSFAITVPTQLEEETLSPVDTSLQDTLATILKLSVEMLDAKVSYAQVVENQIIVTVENYQVTITRTPGAWKTILSQESTGSTIGYYPYGQNPHIDAGLSRYLPRPTSR